MKKNLIAVTMLVAGIVSLSACKDEAPPQEPLTLPVIEVSPRPFANTYNFSGFTTADSTVEVTARVNGYIMERKFSEGDYIEKGEKLFQIEPYQYEANLKSAQATVISGKADVEKTSADLARVQSLFKNGNASKAAYDTARAAFDNATARLMMGEANLKIAELDVAYTKVAAPISGKISMSNFDVGNLVTPGMHLTTIVDSDPIRVHIGISEGFLMTFMDYFTTDENLGKIEAKMTLRNGDEYTHKGKISFFDVKVDTSSNTVNTRVEFPNPDGSVLPGQFVTVTLKEPVVKDTILLPQEVILINQGQHVVMVLEKGVVAAKPVSVGQEDGRYIVITSGLKEGELVIAGSLQKIRTGMPAKYKKVEQENIDNNSKASE